MPRILPRLLEFIHPRKRAAMSNELAPYVKGMVFRATLQLRTPLYVLERDGETCDPRDIPEPDFPPWAGIWTMQAPSLDGLLGLNGLDQAIDDMSSATHIGPQIRREYLPFLIAFRQIVEGDGDREQVIDSLRRLPDNPDWSEFYRLHGGAETMLRHAC